MALRYDDWDTLDETARRQVSHVAKGRAMAEARSLLGLQPVGPGLTTISEDGAWYAALAELFRAVREAR